MHGGGPATDSVQVGQVNFPTSCAAEAGAKVETGVALLHSFQYEEAEQSFSEAAKRDPKCAIAYWGKAMTRYEQLWEFPQGKTLKRGLADIQQAQTVGAGTDRERSYIAAAAAFYSDDSKLSHKKRIQNYSVALDKLRRESPQDVNAAAFYALSLIALAEEENGESSDNANRKAAIALLQSGEESKARQLVEELKKVPGASADSISEHQADFTARNAFELHRWKEAAALPIPAVRRDAQKPTYRVRAIGAARAGDADAARK